jgi:hypothetical protein
LLIAIFTIVLAVKTSGLSSETAGLRESTEKLWLSGEKQIAIAKTSANAAQKAAEVAERALTGVERPILFLTMPEGQIAVPDGMLDEGRPIFRIVAENIGKQVATVTAGAANFIVQKDSLPPPLIMLDKVSGTVCHIRIVGEIAIIPGKTFHFVCQRGDALTDEEVLGLRNGALYGFFRVALFYSDPVGTNRLSISVFVQMPDASRHERGFVQILSSDSLPENTKTSAEEKKEAQRTFVGGALKFYRDFDSRGRAAETSQSDPGPHK